MTTEALKQAREALVDILPYVKDIGRFAKVDPAIAALDAAIAQEAAQLKPSRALDLVHEQAEDEGLWFVARTAPEAHLQSALRALHAAVESRAQERCAAQNKIEPDGSELGSSMCPSCGAEGTTMHRPAVAGQLE